ncbi:MAG TPA: ParA family protein [Phototrophicaceae bacterium]|nr:ParA family protein [Phototrophicaceae bacterium]
MVNVVVFINEKGGVAKTTLSVHAAAGLADMGQRVLLIDADAQGDATIALGLEKEPCLYDLLIRDAEFSDVIRQPDPQCYLRPGTEQPGSLMLIPSNLETRGIATNMGSNLWTLRERVEELEGLIDTVVIDTSPTPDVLHGMIYKAATHIICPCQLEKFSMVGLAETLSRKRIADTERVGFNIPASQLIGIQPVLYRARNKGTGITIHDHNLKTLLDEFKRLTWPSIPQRSTFAEAAEAAMTVWAYAPKSETAQIAWTFVERVQNGIAA